MSDKLKALDEKLQPLLLPLKDVDMPTADAHKVAKVFADILEACIEHFDTRPVPDPEQQEGLRVALEEARIAGDIFKNSFEKAEAVIREARVLWGQGQEKQAVWKLESYLSGASSRTEAALASPKAERKTFCLECGSDEIGYVTQADRDAAAKNKPSVLKAVREALAKSQPAHVVESPTVSIDDVVSVYLPKSQPAEKCKDCGGRGWKMDSRTITKMFPCPRGCKPAEKEKP